MKRIVVLVSVLILGFGSLGFAKSQYSRLTEKVVVDKTLYNYVMLTGDSIQKVWATPISLMTSDALKGKVASLPVSPVLRVDYRTDSPGPTETGQVASQKKYIWGVPAGTALKKEPSVPRYEMVNDKYVPRVPFPHSMIFRWGL